MAVKLFQVAEVLGEAWQGDDESNEEAERIAAAINGKLTIKLCDGALGRLSCGCLAKWSGWRYLVFIATSR